MKMNKRADITIMILVIGVVGICILTILSFVGSNNDREKDFLGIGLIETMNSIDEELDFSEETEFNGDYGNVFERKNVKINIEGNRVVNGSYSIEECNYWVVDCEDKKMVWVEYRK